MDGDPRRIKRFTQGADGLARLCARSSDAMGRQGAPWANDKRVAAQVTGIEVDVGFARAQRRTDRRGVGYAWADQLAVGRKLARQLAAQLRELPGTRGKGFLSLGCF